jgi:hypothetical protein
LAEQKHTALFSVTDARDPPRKVTASLLARPASVPLVALSSLLAFAPLFAYALSATTPRRARASSSGPRKSPAITQLKSTNTSGLESSLHGPDASLPASPKRSKGNPSYITPTESKRICAGAIDRRCDELKSESTTDLFGLKALPPGNSAAFDKPPDIPVQHFEKNGKCSNDAYGHTSNFERDSQSNHFFSAVSDHQLTTICILQVVDLTLHLGRPRNQFSANFVANYTKKSEKCHVSRRMMQVIENQTRIQPQI